MYARVSLEFAEKPDASVIPLATVLEADGESFVYVADKADAETTIVRKQPIETGIVDAEQVEVTQGISPDDLIISLGNRLVKDGDQVQVMRVEEAGVPPGNYGPPKDLEILGAE